MGHLGAGIFEIQRTGDDTSGQIWERTRRMGVNTLAFRLPQHRTFFHLDADCVGITKAVPWELNRHWLDLVASSGTALFVSPQEGATGVEQRKALREAFAMVVSPQAGAWPVDFFHETTPEAWQKRDGSVKQYPWCVARGAWPFTV
jgi:alpha-galactosidase